MFGTASTQNATTTTNSRNPMFSNMFTDETPIENVQSLLHATSTQTNHARSVSLQDTPVDIPPTALAIWRDVRSHLSAEVKAVARANFLNYLADHNMLPRWSVGLESLPGFLTNHEPTVTQLVQLRHMQGLELLRSAKQALLAQAQHHHQVGSAYKHSLQLVYGTNEDGHKEATAKLTNLITRDRDACRSILMRRAETLNQDPLTDEQLCQSMKTANNNVPRNRARSRSPGPNQPNPRGGASVRWRGSTRGRGRGRGSQRGRGRPYNPRSNTGNSRNVQTNSDLSPEEIALITEHRSQTNGQSNNNF
jgi:hypothetical protein